MPKALPSFLSGAIAFAAQCAHAHPGHRLAAASHWHASDTLGLLLVGMAASAVCWFLRGK